MWLYKGFLRRRDQTSPPVANGSRQSTCEQRFMYALHTVIDDSYMRFIYAYTCYLGHTHGIHVLCRPYIRLSRSNASVRAHIQFRQKGFRLVNGIPALIKFGYTDYRGSLGSWQKLTIGTRARVEDGKRWRSSTRESVKDGKTWGAIVECVDGGRLLSTAGYLAHTKLSPL